MVRKKKNNNYLKLIVAIAIPQLAGWIGALFTTPRIESWYNHLNKPFFSPPNWIFAPVWTVLFLLMGLSLYLIWNRKKITDKALKFFWIQLFLNVLWSIIFFGWGNLGLALLEIFFLWIFIKKTIDEFFKINKVAAGLLIPYILWVSFATLLNAAVWWVNM